MSYETIRCKVQQRIAYLTLNRPEKMNAINTLMREELHTCIDELRADDAVRGIILTGAGKAFMAGADLAEINAITDDQTRYAANERMKRDIHALYRKIEYCEKPVLAAVNGYAMGGGFELALACDLRYAGTRAKFSLPEVKLGPAPGFGGTQRLSRLVGLGNAVDLCISGRTITAEEAHAMGAVNRVVDQDQLLEEATSMMLLIIANAPLAIRYNKLAVKRGYDMALDDGLEFELTVSGLADRTEDAKEGVAAFNEKRPPQFQNR